MKNLVLIPLKKKEPKTDIYTKEEFARILENFKPYHRSRDWRIPWTVELIEYYKDEWDWMALSENPYLPWSEELVDKFIDKWYWGGFEPFPYPDPYSETEESYSIESGVSNISKLKWTHEMIRKYKDRIFWYNFSLNEGIEWTFDLFLEFKHLMVPRIVEQSQKLWEKVFFPYLDEEIIAEIFEENK